MTRDLLKKNCRRRRSQNLRNKSTNLALHKEETKYVSHKRTRRAKRTAASRNASQKTDRSRNFRRFRGFSRDGRTRGRDFAGRHSLWISTNLFLSFFFARGSVCFLSHRGGTGSAERGDFRGETRATREKGSGDARIRSRGVLERWNKKESGNISVRKLEIDCLIS